MYDPTTIDLPIGYGSQAKPAHSELKNVASFFEYDRYFDEDKMRKAKAAYYGLTSFMDNCVGRVLNALDASGAADNTIVVYVSDHGDMMGDQGFWTKQVMYEQSVGVPMIAAGPNIPSGKRIKTGTSLLDLAATAKDIAGINSNNGAGKSLCSIANEPDDPDRTIFSEYHDGGSTTGTFMVRWQNWKFVYYVNHDPQLFDLEEDPNELMNLTVHAVNNVRIQEALAEGEKRLRDICDPEAVNTRCFADQTQRIEDLGGRDACINAYVFNHTPTPDEQDILSEGSPL
jgi:choline-sulfatase